MVNSNSLLADLIAFSVFSAAVFVVQIGTVIAGAFK